MARYADPGPLDFDLFWMVFWDILNPALLNRALLNPALLNQVLLNRALLNRALLNGALLNRRSSEHSMGDASQQGTALAVQTSVLQSLVRKSPEYS